ncbi:hypothetical protein LTR36_007866 [Oleoguttula mirabilis]|uniref:NADH dehydrogenase subunit 6 n=1 Tax=Oleoguttula mirabilis TaxID=1507867 RepID=A0AAV9J9W4_9PEZI|nr:hypothetical protein LTR36_007866 [Oleoguttula mirabilis]
MFLSGQMAQGAILVTNQNFGAQPYQVWLLVLAFCAGGFVLGTFVAKHIALLEVIVAVFFVLGYAANIVVFWVMSPRTQQRRCSPTFNNGDIAKILTVFIAFAFVVLLSPIDLGSYVAFEATISLQLISLFATYIVAIGTLFYRRFYGPPLPERRW